MKIYHEFYFPWKRNRVNEKPPRPLRETREAGGGVF